MIPQMRHQGLCWQMCNWFWLTNTCCVGILYWIAGIEAPLCIYLQSIISTCPQIPMALHKCQGQSFCKSWFGWNWLFSLQKLSFTLMQIVKGNGHIQINLVKYRWYSFSYKAMDKGNIVQYCHLLCVYQPVILLV